MVHRPRAITRFPYQDWDTRIRVYSDTDFAGCRETRKSMSGGMMYMGKHWVKGWLTTQAVLALFRRGRIFWAGQGSISRTWVHGNVGGNRCAGHQVRTFDGCIGGKRYFR